MEDIFGGDVGGSPMKAWAAQGNEDPERGMSRLRPGVMAGSLQHPFPFEDGDGYRASIKSFGSIAARTHGAPIALVNLKDLIGIQTSINQQRLVEHIRDPRMNDDRRAPGHGGMIDRPVVVKWGGKLFIHDGHHRLTAAHLRGLETAKVRLVDLDAESAGGQGR